MADIRDELITRQHIQDNLEQMEGSPTKDCETDVGTTPDGDAAREEAQVAAETTPGEIVATSSNITDKQDKQRHRYQAKPLTHQNAMVVNMTHDHAHVR